MNTVLWHSTTETVVRNAEGDEIVIAPETAVNAALLRKKARAALTVNADYLALAAPDLAQVRAQVNILTRECSALIRLAVNALDTIEGT